MSAAALEQIDNGEKIMDDAVSTVKEFAGGDESRIEALFIAAARHLLRKTDYDELPILDETGSVMAFVTRVGSRRLSPCEERSLDRIVEKYEIS